MRNQYHKKAGQNIATAIHFLGKLNAADVAQVMFLDIGLERTAAGTRRGGVMKRQTTASPRLI